MSHSPTELASHAPPTVSGDDGSEVRTRQYELLLDTTTQMLVTAKLHERLLLALEAITTGLGYPQAAIALVDERRSSLCVRAAFGFANEEEIMRVEIPLDSGAPCSKVFHEGHPVWLSLREDKSSCLFFDERVWQPHVLALPLFGKEAASERAEFELTRKPRFQDRYWVPESTSCLGALYIGTEQRAIEPAALDYLVRFAELVGIAAAGAIRSERLRGAVSKLQRERQWVESIMKSVADPIVLTNLDNEILLQNRRAEELFSGSESASEGKRRALEMNDLLFSAYLSSAAFSTTEVLQRDITLVDPLEGSDIHFEVISTPALNARGERIGLVSIFRDVTDLREANEELAHNFIKLSQAEAEARRERDRLDLIIENVGHPVAVCDTSGNFILFNRRAELLFQRDDEDATSAATAAVRANSVKLTSFISALASAAEARRQAEIELLDPETDKTLPMEITAGEVLDAKGQVTAVVSILHDLTEIRELERRRVEQQLFESEKLAAVGRLAASIAHEVNNPLEAIKNSLYLLSTGKKFEQNQRFLDVARKETERVSHIIRQMLGFARRTGEAEWASVNQLIEETLILVEKKMRQARVEVVREFDPGLPQIRARADQLRQVFLNLLLNAQQAMERGGRISIRTSPQEGALQPTVSVEISDTGRGIAEADVARIFEPFFSTRTKGTGLGLWVTQDIVRHHGGRIEVTSEEGRRTTFQIILPVDSPTLAETDAANAANKV